LNNRVIIRWSKKWLTTSEYQNQLRSRHISLRDEQTLGAVTACAWREWIKQVNILSEESVCVLMFVSLHT
jgi:hypothetical protein